MKYPSGLYASVRFSDKTNTALRDLATALGIESPTGIDDLHCTVIYSEVPVADDYGIETETLISKPIMALPHSFDVFGDDDNCLVLRISSPKLYILHHSIKLLTDSTHSFPTYEPHVTLTYECSKDLASRVREFNPMDYISEPLEIVSLHLEDRDEDWSAEVTDEADA